MCFRNLEYATKATLRTPARFMTSLYPFRAEEVGDGSCIIYARAGAKLSPAKAVFTLLTKFFALRFCRDILSRCT